MDLEQGKKLIALARESIKTYFSKKDPNIASTIKKEFSEPRGVFVTLHKEEQLRGCIGFTDALFPLYEGVVKAARSAAFSDPRFPPLSQEELPYIALEVSVLTPQRLIEVRNPEDIPKNVQIGKDGLVLVGTFHSGLLLPQVATEYGWDAVTFLNQTCIKAGLPPESWMDFDKCRVYKFQSEVFSEKTPNGEVEKKI